MNNQSTDGTDRLHPLLSAHFSLPVEQTLCTLAQALTIISTNSLQCFSSAYWSLKVFRAFK